jgi:hypothetical protein
MSLPANEFLRRFLLLQLPPGFVRIRNFGFLANRQRATLMPLCFNLVGAASDQSTPQPQPPARSTVLAKCPRCGATVHWLSPELTNQTQCLVRCHPARPT